MTSWREGVKRVERYKLDAFLVTLNKSERHFSPTTRYRDYSISPGLFHWESQSTTRESSPTGQRYVRHKELGSRILLFVRESDVGDSMGASPFLFLGTASYVSHQGERPMAIVWKLDHDMPRISSKQPESPRTQASHAKRGVELEPRCLRDLSGEDEPIDDRAARLIQAAETTPVATTGGA